MTAAPPLARAPVVPALAWLERYILMGVLAGTAASALFAAHNGLVPLQRPLTFALVFWGWFLAGYVACALILFVAGWGAGRLAGSDLPSRLVLAAAVVSLAWVTAASNARAVGALLALGGPSRFSWLCPAAFALSAAGLTAAVVLPVARRGALRLLTLAAIASALAAFAPAPVRAAGPPPLRTVPRASGQRVLLVGMDGADWALLERLFTRGDLPHLSALRARAAWGPLRTIHPTLSPAIWTTIVTGRTPKNHGIRGFGSTQLDGVRHPLPELRPLKRLGWSRLWQLLVRSGQTTYGPITSASRKVPAYWNLATSYGSPVNVVNWWATWPAEPVLGNVISERVNYWPYAGRLDRPEPGLTQPEGLFGQIRDLAMRPAEVGYEEAQRFMDVTPAEFREMASAPHRRLDIRSEFRFFYAHFETTRRHALAVLRASAERFGSSADTLVLFRLVDLASHTSLRHSELVERPPDVTAEDARRFGRVVTGSYQALDAALGAMVAAFGDGNVLVVSDHGFSRQAATGPLAYGHSRAPDGVFLAAGPAFAPGRVEGLTVYDVLPLLAYLKGFAVSDELPGRLPEPAFSAEFRSHHARRRVASYGGAAGALPAESSADVDAEMLERLRAVGYVQ